MAHHDTVGGDDNGTNHRVGRCPSLSPRGVKERTPHEAFIGGRESRSYHFS
jgi:hypothetical protein